MTAFAVATEVLFGDPNLAEAATWRPGGTGGVLVRVIRRQPDRVAEFGGSRALLPTTLIDIRKAEASAIDEGDLIEVGTESFKIVAPPMADALGLVFTCEAMKV